MRNVTMMVAEKLVVNVSEVRAMKTSPPTDIGCRSKP